MKNFGYIAFKKAISVPIKVEISSCNFFNIGEKQGDPLIAELLTTLCMMIYELAYNLIMLLILLITALANKVKVTSKINLHYISEKVIAFN